METNHKLLQENVELRNEVHCLRHELERMEAYAKEADELNEQKAMTILSLKKEIADMADKIQKQELNQDSEHTCDTMNEEFV